MPTNAARLPSAAEMLRASFKPLFCVYVYMLVLLPSGSIIGVNVKMICFILLLPSAFLRFLDKGRTGLIEISLLLATPAVLLFWILLSQIYGYDVFLTLGQYKETIVTLVSCWLAAVACDETEDSKLNLLRTILHAEVAACVLKMLLLGYSFVSGVPVSVMVNAISNAFGVDLMGMDFEAALGRIQFVADGLIPLCIYLLLRYRVKLRVSTLSALFMLLLLVLSLIFTFSRYFWAFAAVAFVLGLLLGRKDRFHGWVFGLLGVATLACLPLLVTLFQLRFSAQVADSSDSIRAQQIPALGDYFRSAPLLGHGFGSHTEAVIRSRLVPYEYEVQLYALAGQIGIVGLMLLLLLLGLYFKPLWIRDNKSLGQKLSLLVLLLIWLAAGLFNPMLLSSAAAMSYAALRALAGVGDSEPGLHQTPRPALPQA